MKELLWIVRTLVNERSAEFPLKFALTCAHGSVGHISFSRRGGRVYFDGFKEAPDANALPSDAEAFPLLVSCVDGRGREFSTVMNESRSPSGRA
jgi:hypothetical protein